MNEVKACPYKRPDRKYSQLTLAEAKRGETYFWANNRLNPDGTRSKQARVRQPETNGSH